MSMECMHNASSSLSMQTFPFRGNWRILLAYPLCGVTEDIIPLIVWSPSKEREYRWPAYLDYSSTVLERYLTRTPPLQSLLSNLVQIDPLLDQHNYSSIVRTRRTMYITSAMYGSCSALTSITVSFFTVVLQTSVVLEYCTYTTTE
jgi:hypothetical protein